MSRHKPQCGYCGSVDRVKRKENSDRSESVLLCRGCQKTYSVDAIGNDWEPLIHIGELCISDLFLTIRRIIREELARRKPRA